MSSERDSAAGSQYEQERQRFTTVVAEGRTRVRTARLWMGASLVQLCCSGLLLYLLWELYRLAAPRRLVAVMVVLLVVTIVLNIAARRMLTLAERWLPSDHAQKLIVYAQRTLFASVMTGWLVVIAGTWAAIAWPAMLSGLITAGLIVWVLCVNGWNARSQLEMCIAVTDNSSAQALQTAMRRRYWAR